MRIREVLFGILVGIMMMGVFGKFLSYGFQVPHAPAPKPALPPRTLPLQFPLPSPSPLEIEDNVIKLPRGRALDLKKGSVAWHWLKPEEMDYHFATRPFRPGEKPRRIIIQERR